MRYAGPFALAIVALWVAGCETFSGEGPKPVADAGADSKSPTGCATMYVDRTNGADANNGCSTTTAKGSIGAALAAARVPLAEVREIRVCAGNYAEADLTLDVPVTMRGGYACSASFGREPTFGADANWVFTNATNVSNSNTAKAGAPALRIVGAAIGATVEVEGFFFRGPTKSSLASLAVDVQQASPWIHDNDVVVEGAAVREIGGVIGIQLTETNARVTRNRVTVSGGGGTHYGSTAIFADNGGTVEIEANQLVAAGGQGDAGGSVGIVAKVGIKAMRNGIVVEGGAGVKGTYTQTLGIDVEVIGERTVELANNVVVSSGAGCPAETSECLVAGLALARGKGANLHGNVVYVTASPRPAGAPPFTVLGLVGVVVSEALSAIVDSNVVVVDSSKASVPPALLSRTAVLLAGAPNGAFVGNTVVLPPTPAPLGGSLGVFVGGTPAGTIQTSSLDFSRNVIAGFNDSGVLGSNVDIAVMRTVCGNNGFDGGGPRGNVIVGAAALEVFNACTLDLLPVRSLPTARFPGDIGPSADPRYPCHLQAGTGACAAGVFASIKAGDWKATTLEHGLKLAEPAGCALLGAGGNIRPGLALDLLGRPRVNPITPGAYERVGTCP